jgi:hypothetical protein
LALLATHNYFGLWEATVVVVAALAAGATILHAPKLHVLILFTATWGSVLAGTALGSLDTADHLAELLQYMNRSTNEAALLSTVGVALVLPLTLLLFSKVRSTPHSFIARRPFLSLLLFEIVLCFVSFILQTNGMEVAAIIGWLAVFIFTPYLWFLPYAVIDLRAHDSDPMRAIQRLLLEVAQAARLLCRRYHCVVIACMKGDQDRWLFSLDEKKASTLSG